MSFLKKIAEASYVSEFGMDAQFYYDDEESDKIIMNLDEEYDVTKLFPKELLAPIGDQLQKGIKFEIEFEPDSDNPAVEHANIIYKNKKYNIDNFLSEKGIQETFDAHIQEQISENMEDSEAERKYDNWLEKQNR